MEKFDRKMDPTSDQYKEALAELLNKLDPTKPLGTALYKAIARLSWNLYFEGMAIRKDADDGKLKVFLAKRDESDPDWQGHWHAPGSAFRPGESEKDPAKRVAKEYGVPEINFRYIDEYSTWSRPTAVERGSGLSRVYLVDLLGHEPTVNDRRGWFDAYDLPKPMVDSHKDVFIPMAIEAFCAHSNLRIKFAVAGESFEAVGFLNHYEGSVYGPEMFRRTGGATRIIGNLACDFLWRRRDQWPASFQDYRLVTNDCYIADDPRDKTCFVYRDGQWHKELAYIGDQFNKRDLVLQYGK